jgi:hypothetical protein
MLALQSHTEFSTNQESKLSKIVDLEDVKTWIAATDARNEERHKNQVQWNQDHSRRVGGVEKRMNAVEKRIIWLSAIAAAGGGVVGQLAQGLF